MKARGKPRRKAEFGDFQTPLKLARRVCGLLSSQGWKPSSVLEPTCGTGSFLVAALETFPNVRRAVGVDVNGEHVEKTRTALRGMRFEGEIRIMHEDFFHVDWRSVVESLGDPLLVIGNPPWVTNAELGSFGSSNLPKKSNFQGRRGIDAITGKANFDISEWMLLRALEWIDGRRATMAMLCKKVVARKVLLHAWQQGQTLDQSHVYSIDATRHFGAAVDACLLVVQSSPSRHNRDCCVHNALTDSPPDGIFGFREKRLVADTAAFERWKHLEGEQRYQWRSGIKHDCAKVMELRKQEGRYRNGLGETVDLEDEYLYPMLKSSDIANATAAGPRRWMLVTQRTMAEPTHQIQKQAPKTWQYLQNHADLLDRRASSIYRNRPRFAVFGVGDYSFSPWKVAISGFYKRFSFKLVAPVAGKPVVLDDTCYFLSCRSEEEARYIERLLNSETARGFFSAFVFWDAKRPITLDLLRRLDLLALAGELGLQEPPKEFLESCKAADRQLSLFT